MDDSLYDEFGNYCGPELEDSEEESEEGFNDGFQDDDDDEEERRGRQSLIPHVNALSMEISDENRIILHEDKKYYPDAEEVYPGVRTVTLDEDAQDISEPIIKPVKTKTHTVDAKAAPNLQYGTEFMAGLMQNPRSVLFSFSFFQFCFFFIPILFPPIFHSSLIRNIAIIGNFHHGKSVFVDTLVMATQEEVWDPAKELRYTGKHLI